MNWLTPNHVELTHACLFAGAGGLSLGLNQGHARVGTARATMRCLGGVDAWPLAVESFSRITGSKGILMDLFERADYIAFHGKDPPREWREATPSDLLAAFGEAPDILASSPPCKGLSGLLSGDKAESPKYQALNRLVVRGLALALEAFKDNPAALVLLENVPRIQTRGKQLLDELKGLLRAYGYAVNGYPHNCGELGGLGQNRDRYLLVARHTRKVRPFLYVPPKHRVKSIGEVIGSLPLPETPHLGAMHRLPRLTWQTWLRLALIPAGKDWRALHELAVQDGYLRDICLMPLSKGWRAGPYGVRGWAQTACTVAGATGVSNGQFSVADPRLHGYVGSYQPYGVVPMNEPARTVTSQAAPGSGPYSIADQRVCKDGDARFSNAFRLQRWDAPGLAVTSARGSMAAVADPRPAENGRYGSNTHVQDWQDPARTVIGATDVQTGAGLIADPRFMSGKSRDGDWAGGGQYGVVPWEKPSNTVAAKAKHDTGFWSVADPRDLPKPGDRPDPVPRIIALDGAWHRPLTTLELAVLQGYPLQLWDGSMLSFAGRSDSQHREQIGNSVPPPAAAAIATEMARTLLMEALDETFELRDAPIWVQPFVAALAAPSFDEVSA